MSNPLALVCDTDALIQLFIADELRPLLHLKKRYGIQPLVAPEVEFELRSNHHQKHDRIVAGLRKATSQGAIRVVDEGVVMDLTGKGPNIASAICQKAKGCGRSYGRWVD